MKIVIIGSLSKECIIKEAEKTFLEKGCSVVTPFDSEFQNLNLILIQTIYYNHIKKADLVVAIPKEIRYGDEYGSQEQKLIFGESTCYELAIAIENKKPIVYWYY